MKIKLLLLLLVFTHSSLIAENISVTADSEFTPKKAIGIIFNNKNSKYYHEVSIKKTINNKFLIEFAEENVTEGSYASAILISDSGEMNFGNVTPINSESLNLDKLSLCENKTDINLESQITVLEELVRIRNKRKEIYQIKLIKSLDKEFINKIEELEDKYGLKYSSKINATETPAYELNSRLYNLLSTIKSLE